MIEENPKNITLCNLQVIVMPQGEILCLGKTVGWIKEFGKYLTPISEIKQKGDDKMRSFSVQSKDLFDRNKNPKLSLSVKNILKNKKIKKKEIK